jgi:CHASE3 domain sensor protein
MYVNGYLLFAIYFIAVLALGVSVYALWSLEEIRQYYEKMYNRKNNAYRVNQSTTVRPNKKHSQAIGYFDKF